MQTNTVDVDAAAIDATLEQVADVSAEPLASSDPAPAVAATPVDWSAAMNGVAQMFSKVFAPNWQLSEDETALLASEGGKTLEAFFPNFILQGKWLALFSFSIVTGGIIMQRFDTETLKFKPRRLPKADAANAPTLKPPPAPPPPPASSANVVEFPRDRVVAPAWVGNGL